MRLEKSDDAKVLEFLSKAGRSRENSEAWAHALFDLQESYERIFEKLLPEALSSSRNCRDVLGDIREEFRHIEYHVQDIEGK